MCDVLAGVTHIPGFCLSIVCTVHTCRSFLFALLCLPGWLARKHADVLLESGIDGWTAF